MSNTKGSMLISNANAVGTELVNQLGGTGYTPAEWADAINLLGISDDDKASALAGITEGTYTGTERGAIKYSNCNAVGSMLNKKFSTDRGFKPVEWESAISKLTPLAEGTVIGSICNIVNGADRVPLKNWQVTLPASLSGYSAIECEQMGKNLLNANGSSYTFQVGDNFRYNCGMVSLKKGVTYTFSALQEDALTSNTRNTLVIGVNENYTYEYATGTNYHNQSGVHSMQYTPSEDCEAVFLVWVHSPSNAVKYSDFMLEVGSTATTYEAYTAPTVSTVNLGRTIYGGTADIITGEGEDENGNDFTFTPITPTPETALGVNNFWADNGDSTITYRKDPDIPDPPVQLLNMNNNNEDNNEGV